MWQEFRKFSPKYFDLSTMICNVNTSLRILSLNVDSRCETPIPLIFYLLTISCVVCYYYAYVFSTIWFVFHRSLQTGNLIAAMVAGSLTVSSQIATIKLFYMIFHAPKLRSLVDQCLELDALSMPDTRFSKNKGRVLKKVKMRAVSFSICVMMISTLYNFIPVFMPGSHLPEDLLVFYGLEPVFETPYFQITYLIMVYCVTFICYTCSSITAFIIVIIGYIEAQMLSLSEEIQTIWDDSVEDSIRFEIDDICALYEFKMSLYDDNTKTKINKGVRKRLIHILKTHSRNVTLLRNIDNFFSVPNAVGFGCLGISLIAELLGGLENTYLQIPFTFVQVAMDCFTGQMIMDASFTFERAVYSCKWENFDKDNMKIVLLMLQNSQRTLTLSAGGMAVLNFSTLMSIVRSVYSSYTTLRSML